jgi:aspartyl protease family protein
MLVDTGASLVALSEEDARLAGSPWRERDFSSHDSNRERSLSGRHPVRIREMRVGDILVRDVEAIVLPAGRLGTSLLGMTFYAVSAGSRSRKGRLTLRS